MFRKGFKLMIAVFLLSSITAGCKASEPQSNITVKQKEAISGTIIAAGSTALQPLAEKAAADFMKQHAHVSIAVQGGGSETGINQVASGSIQIGNSDVPVQKVLENQKSKGLVDNRVAALAFAVVVNSGVNIENLTTQQVQDIFSGRFTSWKDVGGSDAPIHVINRPVSSGTRTIFEKTLLRDQRANDSIGTIEETNMAIEQAVHSTPGAISYLAMPYLVGERKDALKIVKLDGAEPSMNHIITGKYPFWAYQYMVTKGEAKGAVKEYIDYIISKNFEQRVEELGYIPMTKLKQ
ncbi:phosphate ABC transporter substrate-binding protein PstS family protein [Ectobacillus panaciterrae]|uniref:phosphate ABC transporter substrate-binding protein PstS family protein n=1 Tax=Ectobacillus panaciterrae TaxID=363872 RepID=UPI0004014FD7|nr:phosphate ABC transporter substrate-binding protein PstS family protein [Ectobacillus panaciterrae]